MSSFYQVLLSQIFYHWNILLLMLASFAFLGVSFKFICVGKLGVVSKQSKNFSEVLRILLAEEICIYGIISIIDISMVSSFDKNESLLRLILFISLLDCSSWFFLPLRESLVICWKFRNYRKLRSGCNVIGILWIKLK